MHATQSPRGRLRSVALLLAILSAFALASNHYFGALSAGAEATGSSFSGDALLRKSLVWADLSANALKPTSDPIVFPSPTPEELAHWEERVERIFICFSLSSKHLTQHTNVYRHVVSIKSPELGMRQDDLYRVLLHSLWASCYYKFISRPVGSLHRLSQEEVETLIDVAAIPRRFSNQLLQDIDKTIKHFAVR
ncbi:hypothetical protein Efla_001353 [Eimeria flavescens]